MPARRQANGSSESIDNYLKAILTLGGPQETRVTSTALADRLSVAPASITNMLQKLAAAERPLVEYERHRGVRLSSAGKRRALEVVRHHRLIETFLYQVLDYPIEEVHEEAERLEHFISERFEERIAAKLGHPQIDPHGHFIPALDGTFPTQQPPQDILPLSKLRPGQVGRVASVSDSDPEMLRHLASEGIRPGVKLTHRGQLPSNGFYQVRVGSSGKLTLLSHTLAEMISVATN